MPCRKIRQRRRTGTIGHILNGVALESLTEKWGVIRDLGEWLQGGWGTNQEVGVPDLVT